jgi:hypothetical protein
MVHQVGNGGYRYRSESQIVVGDPSRTDGMAARELIALIYSSSI